MCVGLRNGRLLAIMMVYYVRNVLGSYWCLNRVDECIAVVTEFDVGRNLTAVTRDQQAVGFDVVTSYKTPWARRREWLHYLRNRAGSLLA